MPESMYTEELNAAIRRAINTTVEAFADKCTDRVLEHLLIDQVEARSRAVMDAHMVAIDVLEDAIAGRRNAKSYNETPDRFVRPLTIAVPGDPNWIEPGASHV
jgi:hypothetical protein